ncbi:hypothetical protein [Roseateles sp.]|uniref:hypothetical protein n=1 Tax=Roseateles sp. TaxID=1971397 RepID=UPI0031E48748
MARLSKTTSSASRAPATATASSPFPSRPLLLCSALLAAGAAQAQSSSSTTSGAGNAPLPVVNQSVAQPALVTVRSDDRQVFTATDSRPAAFEANWTPIKMPTGQKTALLGVSYMVAINEDWGLGPAAYGAAKGEFGGLFTVGFNLQRRFRIAQDWHVAASLYAGAGGGVSSDKVRPGGGLMIRPELSVRREFGNWYLGAGVAHTAFPNGSGNIKDTGVMLTLGRMDRFLSFDPSLSGRDGRTGDRTGMGFDEIALSAGVEKPRSGSRTRGGVPLTGRKAKAGADLRQYFGNGSSWWGLEASGAASGGHDGYMEILANAGQDWGIGSERFRVGGQVSVGLGGGGDMDTGGGWLVRVGPTMRWITPWGPTLRLDAGYMKAPWGNYDSFQVRGSLALPLEKVSRMLSSPPLESGTIRAQSWYIAMPHFKEFVFKDGTREGVTGLGLGMTRDFGGPWYGTAQAGSAALGKAGAFSYGMFGLGAHSPKWSGVRVGAEALVGAAGGGGVSVGGGAVTQGELWAQWEGTGQSDRLRVKLGVGQWKALGGDKHSTPMVSLNIGWAFGTLGPAAKR